MRFFARWGHGLIWVMVALAGMLALAACGPFAVSTPRATAVLPSQPDVTIPTDLTPIVVSGTPVIIASAIEFTPTAPPSGGGQTGPTPTPLPTGVPPENFTQPTWTPEPPLQTPGGPQTDPQIVNFTITPDSTLEFGKPVIVTWDVHADRAVLAYEYTNGYSDWSYGDTIILDRLKGSIEIPLKAVDSLPLYVTFKLTVMNLQHDPASGQDMVLAEATDEAHLPMKCPHPWFFEDPPRWCSMLPSEPVGGVVQKFEKATLVAIENAGMTPHNAIHVLFDDGFWTTYPVIAPASGVTPIPGDPYTADPVFVDALEKNRFYDQLLKVSTGKPIGPATAYTARYQCEFLPEIYLSVMECFFNLPDGRIIWQYQNGAYGRVGISWSEWQGPQP